MYVQNETDVTILYTVMLGEVHSGTILPGQSIEIASPVEHVTFSADDGTPFPSDLSVTLAVR
jgi:hypothetical protein